MGVPNSWVDLLEDVQFVLDYLQRDSGVTVGGMYQPLRERVMFTDILLSMRGFSVRKQKLEDIMPMVIPWLKA